MKGWRKTLLDSAASLGGAMVVQSPEASRGDRAAQPAVVERELPRLWRLARSMALTGGVRVASAAGMIVLTVVLARVLSVEDFGRFSLCFTTLLMLSLLCRWGAENALMRYAGSAWHRGNRAVFRAYCRISLAVAMRNSALLTLCGVPLLWWLGPTYWPASRAMAAMLVALVPWSLIFSISYIFKAAGRSQIGSVFETGSIALCGAAVVSAAYVAGYPVDPVGVALVLAVCATALAVFGAALLVRQGLWSAGAEAADEVDRKPFLAYSLNLMSITLMQLLANWGGTFVLELAWNQREVAMFASAARLAMVSVLLVSVASLVVGPRLSAVHDSGDRASFRQLVSSASLIALATNVPVLVILIVGSQQIMTVLGEAYAASGILLSLIAAGQLLGLVFCFAPVILAMSGHDRELRTITLFSSSVCILVTAALAIPYGALGVAIGAGLYPVVQNWTAAVVVRRTLAFWPLAGGHRCREPLPAAA